MKRQGARGFSLVEILIVVMILGILAAIAIPKMSNASQLARESAIKEDLRLLRTQLGVYKSQHGEYPGYPNGDISQTPTEAVAHDQLMKYTSINGTVSATGSSFYCFGPYLESLPANPITGKTGWTIVGDGAAFIADGTTGWLYQPSTGQIRANNPGNDSGGRPIVEY